MSKLSKHVLKMANEKRCNYGSVSAYDLAKEVEALEAENNAIMRDYQIEGDESVRDIVKRTTAAAVKFRDELAELKEAYSTSGEAINILRLHVANAEAREAKLKAEVKTLEAELDSCLSDYNMIR